MNNNLITQFRKPDQVYSTNLIKSTNIIKPINIKKIKDAQTLLQSTKVGGGQNIPIDQNLHPISKIIIENEMAMDKERKKQEELVFLSQDKFLNFGPFENKEMKKENEELKEENKEMKKEIEELKKENEEMKIKHKNDIKNLINILMN